MNHMVLQQSSGEKSSGDMSWSLEMVYRVPLEGKLDREEGAEP